MVEEGQTSSLSLMENEGPTSPSILTEPRGPSAIDEPSLILGELAGPSQEDEELRRQYQELRQQNQELEKIVGVMKLSQELPLSRIVVEAIMTKMQHPHHSVGKKEDY